LSRICVTPGADPAEVKTYRNPPTAGIYHDLFVKALALADEKGGCILMVSIDVIHLTESELAEMREGIRKSTGLEDSNVLLCVSHTHSGATREECLQPFVLTLETYSKTLIGAVIRVAKEALSSMEISMLRFGRGRLSISINRRWRNPNGFPIWMGNPYGEIDPEVATLWVENQNREIRAVVMSYACHASAIGTPLIGNDYPGFAEEIVENRYPGSTALFAQGCAGEIKPYNVDRGFRFMYGIPPAVAAGLGWELAKESCRVIEAAPNEDLSGDIRVAKRTIELPMEGLAGREEIEGRTACEKEEAERWRKDMLKALEGGSLDVVPRIVPYQIQVVGIGERFRLVTLQGEPCVRIGLRIKEQLSVNSATQSRDARNERAVAVFGYTNGGNCYVPSREVVTAGGYEAESYLFNRWAGPFKPEVEDLIVSAVLSMDRQIS
jgi:hypothetical protein